MFTAVSFVGLPAAFGTRELRNRGVVCGAVGFAFVYALAIVNLHFSGARPTIGALAGIPGILRYHHVAVVLQTVFLYFPVAFAIYFIERVLGDLTQVVLNLLRAKCCRPN